MRGMRGAADDINKLLTSFSTGIESGSRIPNQIEQGIQVAELYAKTQLTLQTIQTVASVAVAVIAFAAYMRESERRRSH